MASETEFGSQEAFGSQGKLHSIYDRVPRTREVGPMRSVDISHSFVYNVGKNGEISVHL
jgi:hypothetical protein